MGLKDSGTFLISYGQRREVRCAYAGCPRAAFGELAFCAHGEIRVSRTCFCPDHYLESSILYVEGIYRTIEGFSLLDSHFLMSLLRKPHQYIEVRIYRFT